MHLQDMHAIFLGALPLSWKQWSQALYDPVSQDKVTLYLIIERYYEGISCLQNRQLQSKAKKKLPSISKQSTEFSKLRDAGMSYVSWRLSQAPMIICQKHLTDFQEKLIPNYI